MYYLLCFALFLATYVLSLTYVTVLYHRGLAHGAVQLGPGLMRLVATTGSWVTGLDPKGWACMHRRHHLYSDTPDDPHSPIQVGMLGVAMAQLRSYERVLRHLIRGTPRYTQVVADLPFGVSFLNRHRLWWVPYVLHAVIGLLIAVPTGMWLLGFAYFAGIMSHPLQGWAVNSFGHLYGPRNFATPDNSRNNAMVAWLIMGEGYQNNHHQYPGSAKFSYRWWEIDTGYAMCLLLQALGLLTIRREGLIPHPSQLSTAPGA